VREKKIRYCSDPASVDVSKKQKQFGVWMDASRHHHRLLPTRGRREFSVWVTPMSVPTAAQ
jgi:hypothetical protein